VSEQLTLVLPPEAVEVLVERVARLVIERLSATNGSPWMTRCEAAAYLGLPVSRLEKDRRIPCHRATRRVLYHRGELDRFLLGDGVE
jgi:hypothetical protein